MNPDQDLRSLWGEATAALERAVRSADELAGQQFSAEVAGGAVGATVTGGGQLAEIRIRPTARRDIDNLTLGELVVDAVGKAERLAEQARAEILTDVPIGRTTAAEVLADPMRLLPGFARPAPRKEAPP